MMHGLYPKYKWESQRRVKGVLIYKRPNQASFNLTVNQKNDFDVSKIRTQIGVEGTFADHLTTTTAPKKVYLEDHPKICLSEVRWYSDKSNLIENMSGARWGP